MEGVQAAVTAHLDQVSGLVQALSSELRSGIGPAADSLLAFVRAVDWTVPRGKFPLPVCLPCIFPLELTIRVAACSGAMADVLDGIPCGPAADGRRVEEECQLAVLLLVSCL